MVWDGLSFGPSHNGLPSRDRVPRGPFRAGRTVYRVAYTEAGTAAPVFAPIRRPALPSRPGSSGGAAAPLGVSAVEPLLLPGALTAQIGDDEAAEGGDNVSMMSGLRDRVVYQRELFAPCEPSFEPGLDGLVRIDLGDGAWVDHVPGWLRGHEALLEALWTTTDWQAHRRRMYERIVDVPRLVAVLPEDGPGHPLVDALGGTLAAHYGRPFPHVSLAAYRNGRDSVAFHGDRLGRDRDDAIVAIAGLGARRRFLLRPARGGRSRAWALGGGDLLVMGGTCQGTWQHAVPKVAHAELRISVQFRSAPVRAASY